MSTILDTVVGYEDKIIEFVKSAKTPVVSYVVKGLALVEDRLPEVTYPTALPTPIEIVETQAAFVKKFIDANSAIVTGVLVTLAPVAGYSVKKVVRAPRATKAA
ncbi:MAG: hypothetical protein EXQ71_02275 [Acidimicrobiia bacterium]|jgi:hypothetical protein|nr:hypothetical protein [Acidimicrobiia bacterium]